MHIELTRIDYNLVGLTNRNCLKLLPLASNEVTQKVAVGDQDGVIHIFSMKKGEMMPILKSQRGLPISAVALGGNIGQTRDKIFCAAGNEIRGFSKKGKQFLGFDTNLTETIKTIFVEGSNLFVCGAHNLNYFQDCKEFGSYLCGDVIIDVVAIDSEMLNRSLVILACEDKALRVLENMKVIHQVFLSSVPTVLYFYTDERILYGTSEGAVGMLQLAREETKNIVLLATKNQTSEVAALCCYDLSETGCPQLIVARDDGTIEVHTFPTEEEPPKLIFSYCCNESITSIGAGVVGTAGYDEIIVSTFSGWIFGLTTEIVEKNVALSTDSQNVRLSQEAKQKVTRLRSEIEDLEEKIDKERARYQNVSLDDEGAISAIPMSVTINDKFVLNNEDASYSLSLEVQVSIDNVLIQSDVPVDLLDVKKNSAVVSFSECDPSDGNFLLATYRCQLNTTRLELKLRTIEGQYGIVRAYVTPNMQPKCCQVREYRVKPLSLHSRVHAIEESRPYNVLTLSGQFSLAEMHSWVELCLPEVPVKAPAEPQTLYFVSTFLGTMLQASYAKGEAEFKSDNISTISILKDVLSKEATRSSKKRNIDIAWNINEGSIAHTLSLVHPKLTHQLELQRLATIIEAMNEVETEGGLTEEYSQIIKREEEILEEFRQQPAYLDRLFGMITDLYIDVFKFQGVQVKGRIPTLLDLLSAEKYSYEGLLQFFYIN